LATTAVILFGIALCETAARRKLQLLASEPDLPLGNFDKLLGGLLGWAAGVMRVRQVVIAWEETDEPWLHVASWQQGSYKRTREAPVTFDPMLRAEVADVGFLCQNTDRPDAAVLRAVPGGFDWWHGQPIHPDFRDRFGMSSVLSTPMRTETSKGWLFFLDRADKSRMTADDLTMGGILSERVGNWLNRAHLAQLLATNAALEERARVARDLHDSAFHGLTGLALELERLRAMSQAVLPEARRRLEEIQQTVVETQRSMRLLIKSLRRPTPSISPPLGGELRTRLSNLCQRLERQWGLRVESIISGLETVSPERLNDVYFLVHEALINVARHAGASVARLEVAVRSGRVHIDVSDDGRGFAFKGRHDHSTLLARQLGPATLMERAAILGGVMTVDSSETGTRLEIAFPIATVEG
jgi:signal transduction histidine kinase